MADFHVEGAMVYFKARKKKMFIFRNYCLLYQRKVVSLPLKSGDDAYARQMKHVSLRSLNRIIANEF